MQSMRTCTKVFDTYLENFKDPEPQGYMEKLAFALGIYQDARDEGLGIYKSLQRVVEETMQNFTSRN